MNATEPSDPRPGDILQWLDRHTFSLALLTLLFVTCAGFHFVAVGKARLVQALPGYPSFLVDDLVVCRIRAIAFIDSHVGMVLAFLALSAGCLLWLEVRKAPRWAVWGTLASLALPCVGYIWVCLRASHTFLHLAVPAS